MKNLLRILIFLSLPFSTNAQITRIFTAAGSGLNDEPMDVIRHSQQKIITTGYFNQMMFLGSVTLPFTGVDDAFISCQNANGDYEWAKSISGPLQDRGMVLKEDNSGNIYLAGYFKKFAVIGTDTIFSASLSQDVFLAKFDISGNVAWIKAFGGSGIEDVSGLAVTSAGDIWITGQFNGSSQFRSFGFNSSEFYNSGQQGFDVYVAKISASGDVLLAEQIDSEENDRSTGLETDLQNNLYLTVHGTAILHVGTQDVDLGGTRGVLLKLNPAANLLFSKIFFAPFLDVRSLDLRENLVVIGGNFTGGLACTDATFPVLTGNYVNRIFGISMDLNGNYLSHFSESSESDISLNDIEINSQNKIWAGGTFNCTFTSLADALGAGLFNNLGYEDIFVALYASTTSNHRLFEQHLGGNNEDNLNAIHADDNFYPTLAGSFKGTLYMSKPADCFSCNLLPLQTNNFCSTVQYNAIIFKDAVASKDVFCTTALDTLRPVMDIYRRSGSGCNLPVIAPTLTILEDTVIRCSEFDLQIANHLISDNIASYSATWFFNGAPGSSHVSATGEYMVRLTTVDGCRTYWDTVYVNLFDANSDPEVSVEGGTLYETLYAYNGCHNHIPKLVGDAITVTGEMFNPTDSVVWYEETVSGPVVLLTGNNVIDLTDGGSYTYKVFTEEGCEFSTCFTIFDYVIFHSDGGNFTGIGIPGQENNYEPEYNFFVDGSANDTIHICNGLPLKFEFSDSLLYGSDGPFDIPAFGYWEITGPVGFPIGSPPNELPRYSFLEHFNYASVLESGWVHMKFSLLNPPENEDTLYVFEKDVYVFKHTAPPIHIDFNTSTQGLCPGDTMEVTYSVDPDVPYTLNITGTDINPDTTILQFNAPASVSIAVNYIIPGTGCSVTGSASTSIAYKEAPGINMFPLNGRKCPEDSVLLSSEPGQEIAWIGPQGDTVGTAFSLNVVVPGFYYYNLIDPDGCPLLSNSAEVRNITAVIYDSIITSNMCGNLPALIRLASDTNLNYQWLSPLSGSDTLKYINEPGTYSVRVALCSNVDTLVFTVEKGISETGLEALEQSLCEGKTVHLTANDTASNYLWMPANVTTQDYVVEDPGWVILTVSDSLGCVLSDSLYFEEHPNPANPPGLIASQACPGIPLLVTATSNFPLAWFSGPDSPLISIGNTISVNVTTNGQPISAYAIDTTTGCKSDWISTTLDLLTVTNISPLPQSLIFCPGDTITIQPDPAFAIADGIWTGPNQFELESNTLFIPEITASFAGLYTYSAIPDSGYCTLDTGHVELINRILPLNAVVFPDSICAGQQISFQTTPLTDYTYTWSGPNGMSNNDYNWVIPNALPSFSGYYVITSHNENCMRNDSFDVFVSEIPPPVPVLGYDPVVCSGDTLFLFNLDSIHTSNANLIWTGSDEFMQHSPNSVYIPDFQTSMNNGLGLQYSINQCYSAITTAEIHINNLPVFSFEPEYAFCSGDTFVLNGPAVAESYLWSNGTTAISAIVYHADTLTLTITDVNGCKYTDTANVTTFKCDLDDSPNTFSPNGDGINDALVFTVEGGVIYGALIYDRWGRLCKELSGNQSVWDGTNLSGKKVDDGTYFYVLAVEMINGKEKKLQGTITVFD